MEEFVEYLVSELDKIRPNQEEKYAKLDFYFGAALCSACEEEKSKFFMYGEGKDLICTECAGKVIAALDKVV